MRNRNNCMLATVLLFLVFSFFTVSGQTASSAGRVDLLQDNITTQVLEYDWLNKMVNQELYSAYGEYTILKINNINRFMFDVEIKTKQTSIETELNNEFISRITHQVDNSSESEVDEKTEELEEQSSEADRTKIGGMIQPMVNQKVEAYKLKAMEVNKKFQKLERTKSIKNRLLNIIKTEQLTYPNALKEVQKVEETFTEIEHPESILANFNTALNEYNIAYALAKNDTGIQNKNSVARAIDNVDSEIKKLKTLVDNANYPNIFEEIAGLRRALKIEQNFSAVSEPVFCEKDLIEFDVVIKPKSGLNSRIGTTESKFTLKTPITNGVRFDFSTGLVGLMGLNDYSYHLQTNSQDSTKSVIIEDERTDLARLSLGVMMHISARSASEFKPAFTIGLGLNADDISETNAYAGLSLMMGKENQVVLSVGAALSKIDYLIGKYRVGDIIPSSDAGTGLTEKVYRVGFFASFTYNFAGNSTQ